MSGYDVEHGVNFNKQPTQSSRRPDLSSFWNLRNETYGDLPTNNPHAVPSPENLTALMRLAADVFERIQQDLGEDNELLQGMIASLDEDALHPAGKKGMPASFFADLERIDKKKLKKGDECPICRKDFLDDPYPLVVRLPCHKDHIFDLECIQPWLTVQTTCPLDRKELAKKKEAPPPVQDDEEDYDDFYA